MPVQLEEVVSKIQLQEFLEFPNRLYQGNPYFVPAILMDEKQTLDAAKNPAYEFCDVHLWLAKKDGETVGRVAGILNRHEVRQPESKKLRFGWLDFKDDRAVSFALLNEVEQWARREGLEFLEGPVGFSNFDKAGMLTEGFEELSNVVTIYNAPYYPEHLKAFGFESHKDWVEFELKVPAVIPERFLRAKNLVMERFGLHLVPLRRKKDLKRFAERVFELLEDSYANNYDFIPFSPKQKDFYLKQFIGLLPPEYLCVVADKDNQLVGFGITMPSLVKALQRCGGRLLPFGWWHILRALKRPERGELLLIGVHPNWRNKGVHALIFPEIIQTFIDKGIRIVESNPELEENAAVQALWKQFDSRQHKKRTIFAKWLK